MPIITILDPPLPWSSATKTLDFRADDWPPINAALAQWLEAESPAVLIKTKDEFNKKVGDVVRIIMSVLGEKLEESIVGGQRNSLC